MKIPRISAQAAVLVVGLTAGVLYTTLPNSIMTDLVLYDGVVLLALCSAAVGTWRARGLRAHAWAMLTLGLALWLVGELIWVWFDAHGLETFPSVGDAFFLVAYIPMGLGAAALAAPSSARERDVFVWLDAGVLSTVLGAVIWAFLANPYAADASLDWPTKLVSLAYPLADLFLLGFVIQLLLSRRTTNRAGRMFSAGMVAYVCADTWFGWLTLSESYVSGSAVDLVWMAAYTLMGAAALDRSATEGPGLAPDSGLGRGRLAAVLCAVCVPSIMMLFGLHQLGVLGANTATVAALAGGLAMSLVGLRMWTLLRRVRIVEARRGAERLSAVVDHASDAVLLLAADGSIAYASPAVGQWGRDASTCAGELLADWLTEEDRPGLLRQLSSLVGSASGTLVEMRATLVTPAGDTRSVEGTIRNLLDDETVGALVATLADVTTRLDLEAQLRRRAFHDELTGLANRELFTNRLAHALNRASRRDDLAVAVMFIDLDDFKAVNDGMGHGAGDELLRHVADRIRLCVRPEDTPARMGGDEFAVLLEDVPGLEEASKVAHRILEVLALPVRVLDSDIAVPASIGLAPRTYGCSAESLLRDADIAMYSAKAFGKSRVEVFDDSLRTAAERRLQLRLDLPAALAAGQFHVAYQPVHRIREHGLTGFEALLRWQHPEKGAIPPVEFIPAAEASGFIIELGRWVLEQACTQAARWNDRGERPLTMNVNVSGVQLQNPGFIDVVIQTLRDTGLPASLLTLELTESVLIDHERIGGTLRKLRDLGVGLAIDDFGTGYSSLSYLNQFPITSVKIDRSFVRDLSEDQDSSLVRSVLGIADALGLKTVAEGVETSEQLGVLDSLGCPLGQGFYLGRPISPDAVDQLLEATQALPAGVGEV